MAAFSCHVMSDWLVYCGRRVQGQRRLASRSAPRRNRMPYAVAAASLSGAWLQLYAAVSPANGAHRTHEMRQGLNHWNADAEPPGVGRDRAVDRLDLRRPACRQVLEHGRPVIAVTGVGVLHRGADPRLVG